MIGKRLITQRAVSLSEVKDILKDRAEVGELTYEQNLANEYSKKFAKLPAGKAKKLEEAIKAVAPDFTDDVVVKLVDMLPQNPEQFRLVVPKTVKAEDDIQSKILELTQKAID